MPISPEKNVRLRGAVQSFVVTPDDPDATFFLPVILIDLNFSSGGSSYEVGDLLRYSFEDEGWVDVTDFSIEDKGSQEDLDAFLSLPVVCIGRAFGPYGVGDILSYNFGHRMWSGVNVNEQADLDALLTLPVVRITRTFGVYDADDVLIYNFETRGWESSTETPTVEVSTQGHLDSLLNLGLVRVVADFLPYEADDVLSYNFQTGMWEYADEFVNVDSQAELDALRTLPVVRITRDFGEYDEDDVLSYNFETPGWEPSTDTSTVEVSTQGYLDSLLKLGLARVVDAFGDYVVDAILSYSFEDRAWEDAGADEFVNVDSQAELNVLRKLPLVRITANFGKYVENDDLRYNFGTGVWEDAADLKIEVIETQAEFDEIVGKLFLAGDVLVLDENGNNVGELSILKISDDCREVTFDVTLPIADGIVEVMVSAEGVEGIEGIADDLSSRITLIKYLWADQETIQSYLDGEGSIQIRDDDGAEADDVKKNFSQVTATRLENESVYEIATILSMVFESTYKPVEPPIVLEHYTDVYSDTPLGFKQADDMLSDGTFCPRYLCLLIGRLAASKIATVRLGSSLSTLPNWVRAYKNEVYAQLQRWAINAQTAGIKGLTVRGDFDLGDVLLKMKTREHTAEDLEN